MEKRKIGYLGPVGTFGHEAVQVWDPNAIYIPLPSHLHILEAIENGKIPKGMVAIENSIDGSVTDVLDYFIHEARSVRVCGELVIPINQCVFGKPGVSPKDVRMVISHPKGLGQCAKNIHARFPYAQQVAAESTAAAVSMMLKSEVCAVAIAGKAAGHTDAIILLEKFQDAENNTTRFWAVGRQSAKPTGKDKTSLAFETREDAPGALHAVLGVFASHGLNLSKIESRPTKEAMGKYVFLVDVEAHGEEPSLVDALKWVRAYTARCLVFGSYPKWHNGI